MSSGHQLPPGLGEGSASGPERPPAPEPTHRVEFLGRLGFLLTVIALAVHFVALLGRGMAAAMIGEGDVTFEARQMPAAEGLAQAGLKPVVLAAKEG